MKIVIILFMLTACAKGAWVFPVGSYTALEQPVFTSGSDDPAGYGQTFTLTEDIIIIGIELAVRGLSGGLAFNDDYAFRIIAIPEPSSVLLSAVGLGCLLARRRRGLA